jgi:hypothetical protein
MTRLEFMLSAQRALLGFITPNVRSVSGSLTGKSVLVRYLVDGEIEESTREELACASTQIIADLHREWTFEEQFIRLDAPATLRGATLDFHFYERHERLAPE